jgi:capsular exopolysaccharide synthesis family protein
MRKLFDPETQEARREAALDGSMVSIGDEFIFGPDGSEVIWPADLRSVAKLPYPAASTSRLVTDRNDVGGAVESFRLLSHRLRNMKKADGANRVLITSSVPNEGKTVVASNLAITLARGSATVLMVNADMRKPGDPGMFGDGGLPGLADWLEDRQPLADILRRFENGNLWVMPSGTPHQDPGELLQEPAMRRLLDSTKERFDWIIVDSPPINPFMDAHFLAGMTDTTLMVLRAGSTSKEVYQKSLKQLKGVTLAGVVFNGHDEPSREQYYSYYPKQQPKSRS